MVGAGVPLPKVNDAAPGCDGVGLLFPPLPKVNDDGAEVVPVPEKGLLMVVVSAPPAENVNEAPPPVPKIDPDPAGWLAWLG
jgi:hypothetical protein